MRGTIICLIVVVLGLSGCQRYIHKKSSIGQFNLLALDAQQRLVVEGIKPGTNRKIVCAEPSPDALVAQAASLGSALSASLPPAPGAPESAATEISGALAASSAQAAASIGLRTQTIQLMRDGYYRLCEALLNGQIGEDEYQDIVNNIDVFMLSMMSIEQLGDKAFAAQNVSIGAAVGSNAAANQPSTGGNPGGTNVNAGTPVTADSLKTNANAITVNVPSGQGGDVAKYRSQGIVEVMRQYYAWKQIYARESDHRRIELINAKTRYAEAEARRLEAHNIQNQPTVIKYK